VPGDVTYAGEGKASREKKKILSKDKEEKFKVGRNDESNGLAERQQGVRGELEPRADTRRGSVRRVSQKNSNLPLLRLTRIACRVKLLINRLTGEAVAMKMVDLKKHPDAVASVKKEVCIQKILAHSNILKFFGKRTQGTVEYIFLEYAAGGELFDRIGELCLFPLV
jgi:serine/threonine protein kinase